MGTDDAVDPWNFPDHKLLSRAELARLLGVSLDTLDRMESRGEAPPRLRISPRRWGYPVGGIKRWQAAKMAREPGGVFARDGSVRL
jgi:predicted DNA-binding transcriptional regulator AlpA